MPLWLARGLFTRDLASVAVSKFYTPSFLEQLKADATIVNLADKNSYFYENSPLVGAFVG